MAFLLIVKECQLQLTYLSIRFDKVLCASGQMLSVLPPSALPLFQMALKQLCAQLYFMAGRYLYLLAWRQRQSLLSSVNVASIVREIFTVLLAYEPIDCSMIVVCI